MDAQFVTTRDGSLLRGIRESLADAERVLICVAFAAESGVRLLEKELKALQARERKVQLVATTAFASTTPAALSLARELGVEVFTHNASRGTFHPKVYLGLHPRDEARMFVGSANLTAGLAGNVEAGMLLRGSRDDTPIRDAWQWAETWVHEPITEVWTPRGAGPRGDEEIEPALFKLLAREVAKDPLFLTLGRTPRPNRVTAVTRTALWVETERGTGPQQVPAWMLNVAWSALRGQGVLFNKQLLEELRVHRSSAVCALLARLPGIEPFSDGPRVGLRLLRDRLH